MTHRRTIVAGNWKMNLDRAKARDLATAVAARAAEAGTTELVLCPPAVYVETVAAALGGSSPVALGAQNMHDQSSGAFTGEVAPPMLLDLGCRYVILGHSERRTLFGETDAVVNAKTRAALAAGLTPIVCVGETLEEREGGRTAAVVTTQVQGSLAGLTPADLEKIVVAYEPVWAIGTGRVATPQQAQEVHALIRGLLGGLASPAVAAKVRIQYGGSVKPDNAADLAVQPDIDGALVGGASLKADDFLGIAKAFGA
ncbi:MAG: triose-phosphate isomerase [Planctomycetota bacterium]|jgi:triosephosphate isomerase|nr:MAG: triose-phosphate isomerase [Planctomycetota bacterium]